MRCPSRRRLLQVFPGLTPEQADLIHHLARAHSHPETSQYGVYWWKLRSLIAAECPKTNKHVTQCHGDPFDSRLWATTMALEAIDEVLGTHGVEPLGPIDMRKGPPYEYCNTDDPYATTLIYSREGDADNLFIGCCGDIAERHPNW